MCAQPTAPTGGVVTGGDPQKLEMRDACHISEKCRAKAHAKKRRNTPSLLRKQRLRHRWPSVGMTTFSRAGVRSNIENRSSLRRAACQSWMGKGSRHSPGAPDDWGGGQVPPRAPPDISCPHTLLAPPSVLPRNLPFEMPHLFHALHRMGSPRSTLVRLECEVQLEMRVFGKGAARAWNDINDWK